MLSSPLLISPTLFLLLISFHSTTSQCVNTLDFPGTAVSCTDDFGFIRATLICDTQRYQGGLETCLTTIEGNQCQEEEGREWIEGCQSMCDYCASQYAPTAAPTVSPSTASPTVTRTEKPSKEPTTSPTTLSPTTSPTTLSPTTSPTTISPTTSPTTLSPTMPPTTLSPTMPPTTLSPTPSPSPTQTSCTSTSNPNDDGSTGPFYCINNGTVSGLAGNCTCIDCNTGYTGENCDTLVNCTATDNPTDDGNDGNFYCVNGGTCGGTTGSCTCVDCDTGYTGENCDTLVNCTATDNPTDDGNDGNFYCVNGGTCTGTTGTCTCTECDTGYTGDHCHLVSPATPSPTPLLPPSPPTDVLDPTLPNINPSYGYSLCACKSQVYKLAVVETRDFCMAACLGGKVLSCKTLEPGDAPPADFDAYPGPVSARVTCSTYSFPPASPPGLGIVPEVTEDMKRPPTEDEFPADFDDRVELWRSTPPPDTFSWSNQTDLLSFIKNGRWVPNSPSSPPGGVVGIKDLGGPFSENEIAYRDGLRCQTGLLLSPPWMLPSCPTPTSTSGNSLVSLLRTIDAGSCTSHSAIVTLAMMSMRATLFCGPDCTGNNGQGLDFGGKPGTTLQLSANELVICDGTTIKREALKLYSPTLYKVYPSCERELGVLPFLNYAAVNGVLITDNFGRAFIPDHEEVDYAFNTYKSYDYIPQTLPPHYACFNTIHSFAKDNGNNTIVVEAETATKVAAADKSTVQNEVFHNGPVAVSFSASPAFDGLGEGEVYSGAEPNAFTTTKYATVLGWDGEGNWIVMYSDLNWGERGLGKISEEATPLTMYSASAKWAPRPVSASQQS